MQLLLIHENQKSFIAYLLYDSRFYHYRSAKNQIICMRKNKQIGRITEGYIFCSCKSSGARVFCSRARGVTFPTD
jgi:hypothetical protein